MTGLIDWNKVTELRDDVGAEDFDEVVELFLDEVDSTVDALGGEGRSLEHDLHFLKGSASNLGFTAFSELCKDGETKSANGQSDLVDVAAVVAVYKSSKDAFLADFDQKLAG